MGDNVMLNAKNLRQLRPSKKLADRYLGPFKVIGIVGNHGQAYKLELPPAYRIHLVFHVGMLEPYHHRDGVSPELPEPIDVDG